MRIVDRQTFLSLPAGTIFSKYAPCYFDEWMVKGDTIGNNDFFARDLVPTWTVRAASSEDFFDEMARAENEEIGPLDFEIESRDGCFEPNQLFAVLSAGDVEALAASINHIIGRDE